ncbi:GNAT family N-acetyltransferase [Pseudoalteromonas luteoviolacea]|uniref:N-acetyltransferase domain-containing protein n=1 Tax=Pseudoalteromonas luteoviolacea H33 TaxID=1365251 RepID=A0A166ZM60_9GAMM|nr:GNAT family N-acetyltransferase [Pseudoalteromonas luteoviolacea]KZN44456.1 hypothetical protein N476_05525 [Pseudoalteromonas luteoviolacea H33]KZN78473.1 hypothetical protein N477_08715 [Pseudoalteromonas luteoviolacea H33-S]MBQ4878051.1 GNAT family N-acetyltransferase [Pseudoalteromonas luteoviolacea]MBQ4907095.1 GNAT family N-acetyltransferase [Pseudoalteromonas luteoviolacea]
MELITPRLRLRPLTKNDWQLFKKLNQNPDVMAYVADIQAQQTLKSLFDERCTRWQKQTDAWLTLVIERVDTEECIGLHGFKSFSDKPNIAELGFMLCPTQQGYGFAFEASKAVIDYAFIHQGYDTLLATVTVGNNASEQLLNKLGFTVFQIIKQNYQIGEQIFDDLQLTLHNPHR